MCPNIKKQRGVSIIAAIFLIVILSLMGAGMVSLLSTSHQTISQELTSARAYMAGRSCLHWGMYQAVYSPPTTTVSYNKTFDNTNSFLAKAHCTVSIDIIPDHDFNDGRTLIFYNINVIAEYGDITSPEYSKRTLRIQFIP